MARAPFNVLRSAIAASCALAVCMGACARAPVHAALTPAASAGPTDENGISFLPNLVNATGVETLLRFPSSARFDEFPVHGKSFPLRKTMNCSLQVELSTDCSAEEEDEGDEEEEKGVPASGKWIEATATEFCGMTPPPPQPQPPPHTKKTVRREIKK